jgi:hypothetical protein
MKYWEPIYNGTIYPTEYQRIQQDWAVSTNETVTYIVSTNTPFIKGEVVDIVYNNDADETGKAQVSFFGTYANGSNYVTVQHTFDYTTSDVTPTSYIYGKESQSNTLILDYAGYLNTETNNVDRSLRSIPLSEAVYWSPVYVYDYELELNEKNKSIRILDSTYAPQIAKEIKGLLK